MVKFALPNRLEVNHAVSIDNVTELPRTFQSSAIIVGGLFIILLCSNVKNSSCSVLSLNIKNSISWMLSFFFFKFPEKNMHIQPQEDSSVTFFFFFLNQMHLLKLNTGSKTIITV